MSLDNPVRAFLEYLKAGLLHKEALQAILGEHGVWVNPKKITLVEVEESLRGELKVYIMMSKSIWVTLTIVKTSDGEYKVEKVSATWW